MLKESISRNSIILGLFAMIAAFIIAATQVGTKERIRIQQEIAQQKALLEILPADTHNNNLLEDSITLPIGVLNNTNEEQAYIAKMHGQPVAIILPAIAPEGYTGSIKFIVGIRKDGTLAGVRVLEHKETPGLGDKVDIKKSDWILNFNNKSLINPYASLWDVKKDGGEFDQFTGATITPRTMVKTIKQALLYFNQNKAALLNNQPELLNLLVDEWDEEANNV